jgi:hypothetical protein
LAVSAVASATFTHRFQPRYSIDNPMGKSVWQRGQVAPRQREVPALAWPRSRIMSKRALVAR